MTKPKRPTIGLLPFYLKLYDDIMPERRDEFERFLQRVAAGFADRGIDVATGPVCRIAQEFQPAVKAFEESGVDCIVTVHLAYSPSLEAINAFRATRLPVIILDTTMDARFGCDVAADRIMYNHGIHGVMDFASMLRREGKPFEIVAGHVDDGDLFDRAAALIQTVAAPSPFRGRSVLRIGDAFAGMGDFHVDEAVLAERLGLSVHQLDMQGLDDAVRAVTDEAVAAELARDREAYVCDLSEATHARSVRVGLGLRRLLDEGAYLGFSINFQAFDRSDRAADTMPFLEISKSMARGVGYAGEGDVLTAGLVGALAERFDAVTFTEIFCPDWAGDSLFLSHMGEISPRIATGRPRIIEKPFPFGGGCNPAVLACTVQPGPAVFVNLAPGPRDTFALIVAPVDVLPEDAELDPAMRDTVRAWIRPRMPVARFLEAYSRAGGTHHSALVLGDHAEAVAGFGRQSNLTVVEIG
jgi:L-arabinose isomerase